MELESLLYPIALSMINGIGSINAKKLIAYTGSAENVFKEKRQNLLKIPGIGESHADEIKNAETLIKAEEELKFIDKYKIKALYYLNSDYPVRLKECNDSPIILYVRGNVNLNYEKVVSIVGTRQATNYGINCCEKIISGFAKHKHDVMIVSGMAYGIDISAHKLALKNNLPTVGVLGHGLNTIYPASHREYASEIIENGALVTEFPSKIPIDKAFFVRRNRIIAGLADATIVVESAAQGGALITAELANAYNRDVFAIPGRIDDNKSKGCNNLIKNNKAMLINSVEDIEYYLNWINEEKKPIQLQLFTDLTDEENKILNIVRANDEIPLDFISIEAQMPVSKTSSLLLNLELAGLIRCLPGKIYKAI